MSFFFSLYLSFFPFIHLSIYISSLSTLITGSKDFWWGNFGVESGNSFLLSAKKVFFACKHFACILSKVGIKKRFSQNKSTCWLSFSAVGLQKKSRQENQKPICKGVCTYSTKCLVGGHLLTTAARCGGEVGGGERPGSWGVVVKQRGKGRVI